MNREPETTSRDALLALLSAHIGVGNGVTADDLASLLGLLPRQVRSLITRLRLDGVAVCATPERGYFIAASGEELESTCQFLRGRAMHSLVLEARLRKTTLADLIGQLRLPT